MVLKKFLDQKPTENILDGFEKTFCLQNSHFCTFWLTFETSKLAFWTSTRLENFVFADVLCNIEGSMCPLMTPFFSEDNLHHEDVSENMIGSLSLSGKICRDSENETQFLLKRNFVWGNPADFKPLKKTNSKKHQKIAINLRFSL